MRSYVVRSGSPQAWVRLVAKRRDTGEVVESTDIMPFEDLGARLNASVLRMLQTFCSIEIVFEPDA